MSEDSKTKLVHTDRTFVTAELARRWLKENIENNRPLQHSRVQEYMRDMKAGRWMENGSTIVFSNDGKLIDGQHRLQACMEGGVGFWTLVAYEVHSDAFPTIDRGQSRSTGQMLHLTHGMDDYNAVAATISYLYRFQDGIMLTRGRPTSQEADDLLMSNPGIPDAVQASRKIFRRFRAGPIPVLAVCYYLFTRQDQTLAEAFFDALGTGANLRDVDPVYQLRARIISASASSAKRLSSYELLALMFKAWIAEREQRIMKVALRWAQAESFPNIGPIASIKKVRPPVQHPEKAGNLGKKKGKHIKPLPKDTPKKTLDPIDKLVQKHKGLDARALLDKERKGPDA